MHLATCVDEVMAQCEICRTFDEAPHVPAAGTSTVAMFNAKLQVDLLFLDDIIALRIMDLFSKYSFLIPARAKNPQDVWDPCCGSWIAVCGPPMSIQMDEGGEWKTALWTELRFDRRIRLQFQGILVRRNGPVRGICNRLKDDDRFSGKQILAEVQWCLNTAISGGAFPTTRRFYGWEENPVGLYGWEEKDEDLTLAQDTSLSGQFVQQWKLRMMAQEAALNEIADSRL